MAIKKSDDNAETGPETPSAQHDGAAGHALKPAQPQTHPSRWTGPEAMVSLQKTAELLAMAYLVTNLNFKTIPLKEFMDDCERKILLSSLHLSHGNQKNAADLLGLKPTALFEKMRKHGIEGRKIKLSEKLKADPPLGMD